MIRKDLHAGIMELAVANLIGFRTHTIVPNVYWGIGLNHECDMLVLDAQNRFTEVEIKISKADLKADLNKGHGHKSNIISRLVYAVPEDLIELCKEIVPKESGIIGVFYKETKLSYQSDKKYGYYEARWIRNARHRVEKTPSQGTLNKFYHLGCMRIWSLKRHNNKFKPL